MKVKLKTIIRGAQYAGNPGDILDVPDPIGKAWVLADLASTVGAAGAVSEPVKAKEPEAEQAVDEEVEQREKAEAKPKKTAKAKPRKGRRPKKG